MGLTDIINDVFSSSTKQEFWNTISTIEDVNKVLRGSETRPQLIYKHSNRCSVCFAAKGNIENVADDILNQADMHYINVVKHRSASDEVASQCKVPHESPQVIIVSQGEVIGSASHGKISGKNILQLLA